MPDGGTASPPASANRNPYQAVMLVLSVAAGISATAAVAVAFIVHDPVLLQTAISLGLASGTLAGVWLAQGNRWRSPSDPEVRPGKAETEPAESTDAMGNGDSLVEGGDIAPLLPGNRLQRANRYARRIADWASRARQTFAAGAAVDFGGGLAAAGGAAILLTVMISGVVLGPPPPTRLAAVGVALCLAGVGLVSTAVRYLQQIDPHELPEAGALARGGRVLAWVLVLAAASVVVVWADLLNWQRLIFALVAVANTAVCYDMALAAPRSAAPHIDFAITRVCGSRANVLASLLDAAHAQLGIDLRSTWALTVVRSGLEPLAIALILVAWLSTSLTIVDVHEQALIERLGAAVPGQALDPGLHLHFPWPIDRVFRLPVQRVQTLTVGHEGEEEAGPEDVLWARAHAQNEYTLLLGDGRDLITVDAAVQFRVADARAWFYHSQNPGDALRAIAYRAVMRTTVNKTLSEALSENVVATTARMRAMVQQDADALGLGVEVVGFSIGGMHPPTAVAVDYQSVVSAEVAKVTAIVNAQATRNRMVPYTESEALTGANAARAQGADALAKAAGEAWSFLELQSQFRASPAEYLFRRRLEALESGLAGRRFTVVDSRLQRDGGELWITP